MNGDGAERQSAWQAARAAEPLLAEVRADKVFMGIRALTLQPPCEVDGDLMNVAKDDFEDAVGELAMANGSPALQLGQPQSGKAGLS